MGNTSSKTSVQSRDSHGRFAATSDDLVDIAVHNPLHKVTKILEEIKNHQATTFTLRFTIPLIALPIFVAVLFGTFQLGRAQVSCVPVFSSRIGIIRTLSVMVPPTSPNFITQLLSFLPNIPKPDTKNLVSTTRSILISSATLEPMQIVKGSTVSLSPFENKQVIISGTYSACTNTITLDSPQNIVSLK